MSQDPFQALYSGIGGAPLLPSLRSNLYIPQCVLGTLPHLVVPSVRFDGYESYDRAFSRLQSGMSPTS